jgi:lipopolysaccharide transport system ATP-binding protein
LEVGTGFHPELTGRENIYLNGSILGLKKAEINKQLDAIIDFSGVEKFIDTPLKHYSSGMQLRLAFSVAAHLEPEILLIDEVLAVGDAEFQKKCIGKMEEVSKSHGRTILFVSHNMNYIAGLCNKAVLLDTGKVKRIGTANEVITDYRNSIKENFSDDVNNRLPGNDIVRLKSVKIIEDNGLNKDFFSVSEKIGIQMTYDVFKDDHVLWAGYNIHNQDGINVFDTHSIASPYYQQPHEKGNYSATVWIPENLLNTGNYYISCAIFNHQWQVIHFQEKDVSFFTVHEDITENTARGKSTGDFPGIIRPLLNWEIKKTE